MADHFQAAIFFREKENNRQSYSPNNPKTQDQN